MLRIGHSWRTRTGRGTSEVNKERPTGQAGQMREQPQLTISGTPREDSVPGERGGPHQHKQTLRRSEKRHFFTADVTDIFGKNTTRSFPNLRVAFP